MIKAMRVALVVVFLALKLEVNGLDKTVNQLKDEMGGLNNWFRDVSKFTLTIMHACATTLCYLGQDSRCGYPLGD